MKKLLFLFAFLLIAGNAWAANRYVRAAGGNYSDAATWASTSGGTDSVAVPTSSDDVFLDAASGQLTINAAAAAKTFNCTGYTGTLTHNAFTLSVSGSVTFVAGMTYTAATSSSLINFAESGTLTTAGQLLWGLGVASSKTLTLGDNVSFVAQKTPYVTMTGAIAMNGKVISGNSSINRVNLRSSVLGTSASITGVTNTLFANSDFRDIRFTPSVANADIDLSAITGLSGDCGGNSIVGTGTLTFTAAQTPTTLTGSSVSLSASAAQWSGGRVPLPQDVGVISLTAGQTLTVDMPRLWKDISFGTATNLTLSNAVTSYGSVNLTGMGTNSFGQTWTFESQQRSSTITLTSAGKSFGAQVNISVPNTIFQLQDAFSNTGGNVFSGVTIGTFDANGNNVTSARLGGTGGSIIMGSGTWTANTTTATATAWSGSGVSITANSSTILFVNAANTATTFAGGGNTYNNLTTNSGTGGVTITGSNTFNNITVPAAGVLTLTAGTTQNVNTFTGTGTSGAGNCVSLRATAGVVPILNKTGGGVINNDWMCIQGVNVTPSNTWYFGANSKDGKGLDFNGEASAGGYVSAANDAGKNQWSGATSFSYEVWNIARTSGSGSIARAIDKGNGYLATSGTPKYQFQQVFSGGTATADSPTFSFNTLNHVVAVWNGSTLTSYNNGSAGTPTATSGTPTDDSGNSVILGNRLDRTRTFDGQIFLVRIYRNVALTSDEVTALYNGGVLDKNLSNSATAKATQVWKLNEGTGNTLSTTGETGTVTSPAYWANTGWNSGVGSQERTSSQMKVKSSGILRNALSAGVMR